MSTKNFDLENDFIKLDGIFIQPKNLVDTEDSKYFSWTNENECNKMITKNFHKCDDNKKYRKYVKIDAYFIQDETDNEAEISDCD